MGKTVEEAEREEVPSGVVGLRNLGKRTCRTASAMCSYLPNALAELLLLLLMLLMLSLNWIPQSSVVTGACDDDVNSIGLMPAINEQLLDRRD